MHTPAGGIIVAHRNRKGSVVMYTKDSEAARKVRRVAATMAAEGMPLEEEFVLKLLAVARGERTTEDLRKELLEKYKSEK